MEALCAVDNENPRCAPVDAKDHNDFVAAAIEAGVSRLYSP